MNLIFDIGSTRTRIGFTKDGKGVDGHVIYETGKDYFESLSLMKNAVARQGGKVSAIVGCLPGFVSEEGVIKRSGNLPLWIGNNFRQDLFEIFGVYPEIRNDAELANLGESVFGAGRGFDGVAYITVSTGFGGSVSYKKNILPHLTTFEPGRMLMFKEGEFVSIEDLVSGRMLLAKYGQKADDVKDPAVWQELQRWLVAALVNVCFMWSPQVIVLGGGLIEFGHFNLSDMIESIKGVVSEVRMPVIKTAELGAIGGLYGGLVILSNKNNTIV